MQWDLAPLERAHLARTTNVGQASRLPGRAKRGPGGAKAAPFGAAGQAGRLPYVPGATSSGVVLPSCALQTWTRPGAIDAKARSIAHATLARHHRADLEGGVPIPAFLGARSAVGRLGR